jgi:Tol biopolymer transport system component
MNADGTNVARLTNHAAFDQQPAWSPDGSKIAFVSQRDGNSEIYVMHADGSNQTRLTDDDANPAWSPDGRKIAFASNRGENDNWDIYVMPADGSDGDNPTRLTTDSAIDGDPAW